MDRKINRFVWIVFCLTAWCVFGQGKRLKGDDYFFQYSYQRAIASYEQDQAKGTVLNLQQLLNLADSYYKTNAYEKAAGLYFDIYSKDTLITDLQFNKMLQSFSVMANYEQVDSLLMEKSAAFPKELMENAEFNISLFQQPDQKQELEYEIFNARSNTPQSDFSPAFYGDQVLFSSGRTQDKKRRNAISEEGYLNIYRANILEDGQLDAAQKFRDIPNSDYHTATPSFAQGLNTVFYVASNMENGELVFNEYGKNALSINKLKMGGRPQLLFRDLSTSFYYPFYEEKTGRLYFAADFEEGYGGTDLYYVATNNGQIMSAPVNLGPRINSPGNEISPFIFENSLYFASDVFYGLGGMDIYQSNIEGRDTFSIPVNLGPGINSVDDDFGMVIRNNGEGLLGYFASNRKGGQGSDDVYGFKVAEKPGIKTITLKGEVLKAIDDSQSIDNAVVRLLDSDGTVLKETLSDEQGRYRLEIPWREEIVVESTKNRFSTFSQKLGTSEIEAAAADDFTINIALYDDLVEEKEGQTVIKLKKFFFGRGRSALVPEITTELDKVVQFVKSFPAAQLRIETYTDSRGGSSTNFRLTQARSDVIKKYLIEQGVPASNILYSVGYGEQKILNNCTNGVYCLEVLHKRNQRSLIVVLNNNLLFK
nr:OmpA family protein [uncultured Allomuricauda sp.]